MAKYQIQEVTLAYHDLWVEADSLEDAHARFETEISDRNMEESSHFDLNVLIRDENGELVLESNCEGIGDYEGRLVPRLTRIGVDKYGDPIG